MARSREWIESAGVLAMIVVCVCMTYVAMRAAGRLVALLGRTGAGVVGRVSGVLLSGLAIQFILDGLERSPLLG